jgi:hypothetical protein
MGIPAVNRNNQPIETRVQNNLKDTAVARDALDSISSRFNVLNMPISTTALIDANTHV